MPLPTDPTTGMPVDPATGLPMAPSVPPGWSISPQGIPIDPGGALHPEMLPGASSAAASDFPLASTAVGAVAGYFLGKGKGKEQLYAGLGAAAGYLLKPLG
jgi:hypothetical protein